MRLARTDQEIEDCLSAANDANAEGGNWPGMTYEQGVEATLMWVTGQADDNPMEE
jgi:hypothetical protein